MQRSFYQMSRTWYQINAPTTRLLDDFLVLVELDAKQAGSLTIEWGINTPNAPSLNLFSDAWFILPHVQDLFQELSKFSLVTPDQVRSILEQLEFVDDTQSTPPDHLNQELHSQWFEMGRQHALQEQPDITAYLVEPMRSIYSQGFHLGRGESSYGG